MLTTEPLALNGGAPLRDIRSRPWPVWPVVSPELWDRAVGPALREVFLSATEGLPGPVAKRFGTEFAAYCGTRHGVMLPHGTDALSAALAAVLDLDGWREGGEVIIPNYTFIATASAVIDRRCRPVFIDIDPVTLTMCPQALAKAVIPGRTQAVIVVHLAGHPADMAAIRAITDPLGIPVIEDCAQAHGAEVAGKKVGGLGAIGAFSFQSTKNLTSGEGGCVTTDDETLKNRVISFLDVGRDPEGKRWDYPRLGWNYRPSEYLAALLSVRLRSLAGECRRRDESAKILCELLEDIPGVAPPRVAPWVTLHGWHLFAMRLDRSKFGNRPREEIVAAMMAEGIPVTAGYECALSDQPALETLRRRYPDMMTVHPCPNTESVCRDSLWTYQNMLLGEPRDMEDIAAAITKVQQAFNG